MSGHKKIITLQPIINHSLQIFYIARKDCSLYQAENTWVLENTRFTSRVEHLNMTFNLQWYLSLPYSHIIRLVRYLDNEIWIGHKNLLINYLSIPVNVRLSSIGVHCSCIIFRHVRIEISVYHSSWASNL